MVERFVTFVASIWMKKSPNPASERAPSRPVPHDHGQEHRADSFQSTVFGPDELVEECEQDARDTDHTG